MDRGKEGKREKEKRKRASHFVKLQPNQVRFALLEPKEINPVGDNQSFRKRQATGWSKIRTSCSSETKK